MHSALEQLPYPHGRRLLISLIDEHSQQKPDEPWVSIPVDDDDLTKGFKDISWRQFANGVDHAAKWLQDNLPKLAFAEPFQAFGYVGPKDLRYPFFAVAAGRLGLVMVLPSSTVTPQGRLKILQQKDSLIMLHAAENATDAQDVADLDARISTIQAPELDQLLVNQSIDRAPYTKTWEEGKNDPWLCFHTSGTTGHPKVITYSQQMFAATDIIMGLWDTPPHCVHLFVQSRVLIPMPLLHNIGMSMVLAAAAFIGSIPVLLPSSKPPSPTIIRTALEVAHVGTAILVPALVDALCLDAHALDLLRKFDCLCYAGAPLSHTSAHLLGGYVKLAPVIGSTDAGPYLYRIENLESKEDFDYVSFHPSAGVVMEPRGDEMHELVLVKSPKFPVQSIFDVYPDIDKFYTKDLWVEHPTKKGQWRIVGRTDDYVFVQNGDGLYVGTLEPIFEEHPDVRSALLVGQGRSVPLILVEPNEPALPRLTNPKDRQLFLDSFESYVEKANSHCHKIVKLDRKLVVMADAARPFPRTVKDTISRNVAIKLYQREIDEAYQSCGYVDIPRI